MDRCQNTAGATENLYQQALLAWATGHIDQIASAGSDLGRIRDLVDWLAHFTREYFGFQQRILNGYSEQYQYFSERVATHNEFRRRLARLYLDAIRHDAGVAERLRDLCHDLLYDAQAQQEKIADILGRNGSDPRLRRQARRGEPAATAANLFGSLDNTEALSH